VRLIVITTITAVLGPLALSQDPLFKDMPDVLAFGLAIVTLLTPGAVRVLNATLINAKRD
jgi:hypothetical protein